MKRRLTLFDLWTVAVVSVIAMAVLLLLSGVPDVDFHARRDRAALDCAASPAGQNCAGPVR